MRDIAIGEVLSAGGLIEVVQGVINGNGEIEKIVAKPMDPEEAAMQLTTSSLDFLVFRNSRSEEINVIYKRKDGNLKLIEPSS